MVTYQNWQSTLTVQGQNETTPGEEFKDSLNGKQEEIFTFICTTDKLLSLDNINTAYCNNMDELAYSYTGIFITYTSNNI